MRAIDADALINRIVFHTDWSVDKKEAFEDEINAEPTITSERGTGKWVGDTCSKCGKDLWDYFYFSEDGSIIEEPKFCPNCGVKMD